MENKKLYLNDFDDDELAEFVRNADAWDEIGVQERMEILADRADSKLWELYKSGKADDVDNCMTFADDILDWIIDADGNRYFDLDEWDDKVWKAGEILSKLAKDNSDLKTKLSSPYSGCYVSDTYEGWVSIAEYIQTILNVDLGM